MHLSSKFTEHVDILCECDSQSEHSVYAKLTEKYPISRLAPMWQYFGTIACDGLHGIMKLYIDKP